jgi:hypothetical protein
MLQDQNATFRRLSLKVVGRRTYGESLGTGVHSLVHSLTMTHHDEGGHRLYVAADDHSRSRQHIST